MIRKVLPSVALKFDLKFDFKRGSVKDCVNPP